ncbi:hypothetical protein CL621_03390 [archaeon]|nr:hypothetical protein [archaeon]
MEKRDVLRYFLIGAIGVVLISILLVLSGGPTGFAIFGDDEQTEFDLGTYSNVEWNGSAVVLSSAQTSGTYTSQVFDASNDAVWNNLTWVSGEPNIEILFAVDGVADIWNSADGISWSLAKDDYTGAEGNGATYLIKNSSNDLFILYNQDLWQSTDSGVNWVKVNDDINPGASNSGKVMTIDSNDNIYIIDGAERVLKSTDSGISFIAVNDSMGDGNDIGGLTIDSSDNLIAIDNSADVFKSIDSGVTWTKVNDDYNGGMGNAVSDLTSNSSGDLFALHNQDIWYSPDSGSTWILVNDDYNAGGDSNSGQVIYVDSNDYIYIADGSEDIYQSTDSGVSFSRLAENINGASGNIFGLTSISQLTTLDVQTRSCNDDACSDESFVDITDTSPQDLSVDNNRYFQYKIDFTSPDSSISPSLTSIDINYDLVNTAPSLNLVNPQEGASYGYNESLALDFSVSDADDNIDSCWYNFGGKNITLVSCANITFDIAEGSHDLNIYVNDSLGLSASDSASFSVAVGSPSIVLNSPIEEYFNSGLNIVFNYTPTDNDLDSCWLLGNFTGIYSVNQTDTSVTSGEVNSFSLNLSDGEYLWNIGCNDSVGNEAENGNKTFYIDTINPSISLTQPTGAKTSRTVSATWSVSDSSPVNCLYNVYQGASLEIVNTSVNCSDNSASFDVSSDSDFVFNFYVNDSAGNSDSANSSFSVDSSTSSNEGGSPSGGSPGGSSSFILPNKTGKMDVSLIGEIIVHEGENKNLSVNVKNTGRFFLNKCKLSIKGDLNNWIYSNILEGIAPGENLDFIFNINVPESIQPGDYSGELEVKCDEGINVQEIVVSIPGFSGVKINELVQEGKTLTINYNFDNSNFIGDFVLIDIWIVDEAGIEINRIQDEFEINKDGLIERVVELDVGGLSGVYYVYFALSSDLEESIKQSILLGNKGLTGFAILDNTRNKVMVYAVFLILIGAVVFLIWRRHGKKEHKSKVKHPWLLRNPKKRLRKKHK